MTIPIYTGEYPTDEFFDILLYKNVISREGRSRLRIKWSDGDIDDFFYLRTHKVSTVVKAMKEVNENCE